MSSRNNHGNDLVGTRSFQGGLFKMLVFNGSQIVISHNTQLNEDLVHTGSFPTRLEEKMI
jgi:hypothetical protein